MGRGFQGAMMRTFGAIEHEATVVDKTEIVPGFVAIRMTSPTVFDEVRAEPTAWLRFWFPDPTGAGTEHQRAYTIAAADPEIGEFTVHFVLHEPAGPASAWAARARVGDTLATTSLGSKKFAVPAEPPAGYLLVGDPASVPAINSILAVLPEDADVEVYLEYHDKAHRDIPITEHPRAVVRWIPREGPTSLAATLEARDWSDWYAWLGPEAKSMKHLRTRLKSEFGFPKTDTYAQAYWTYGRAMGTYRDDKNVAPEPTPATVTPVKTLPAVESAGTTDATRPDTARPDADPVAATPSRWRSQAGGRLLAPIKSTLILAGVLQAIVSLLQLAPFVVLVEVGRRILDGAAVDDLWTLGIVFVCLMGAGALLASAMVFWLHLVDARFGADLRIAMLAKLARLPLSWFSRHSTGSVKKVVQDDTLSLHYLVTHAILDAVAAVITPIAVLIYLFVADWRLALVLLIPILAYLFGMTVMVTQSGPKIAESSEWDERMDREAGFYLDGQPEIRVFGGGAASPFRTRLDEYIGFLNRWQRPFIGKRTFIDLVTRPATFLWLITTVGTLFVVTDVMDAPSLIPFLVLGTTFGAQLVGIGYGLGGLQTGRLAARRIANTLEEPELSIATGSDSDSDSEDATGSAPRGDGRTVVFDGVVFGYRPNKPVINDVTLTLRPGTVTALVGPSGSGKSTLASLLARFHDPQQGAITIGGRDLRSMPFDELYAAVGFVFQDLALVHGTVAENIALARPDAAPADIEDAARRAQIHDRITTLPHGYDTLIDDPSALSGGERQRLTIARSILADTPILVLDEATAFADPESEYLVQRALGELARDRTVVVIAHRLHTIADADHIVVLDDGYVAEQGTHADLIAAQGRYHQLWQQSSAPLTSTTEG